MKKVLKWIITAALALTMLGCFGCSTTFSADKNITVVTREDGSGTKSAFMEIIGLKGKADVSGVIIGTGTAGVLAEVKGNPYAVAYESLGYVTSDVKTVTVDGIAPTVDNIKSGSYNIARPLNVVYKEATLSGELAKAFYDYIASSDAQTIIGAEGYVSTNAGAKPYTKPTNAGALTGNLNISGSTSLQPLMIKLATEFEKIHTGANVTVAGGGSGTGYNNAQNGTSQFGMISETFNEIKAPDCVHYEVAKDGIAIIVNKANTTQNMSIAQIKNIYNAEQESAGKIVKWSDLK